MGEMAEWINQGSHGEEFEDFAIIANDSRKDGNVNVNAARQKSESTMAKPDKTKKPAAKSTNTGSKRTTLASLWDDTDPGEASNFIPEGQHELRLNELVFKSDPAKGEAAFINYEAIEGEYEGKTGRQMYKLTDADGNKGPGLAYLKRDLALLGYDDIAGKALEKTAKEINEEQPMVVVNAKQNGQYMNYYLQGLVGNSGLETGGGNTSDNDTNDWDEGDKVKWNDDGTERSGEIISINKKKETAKIKDEEDDEFVVDLDDLEAADEGGGGDADEKIKVGDTVEGENDDGDDIKGEVIKIKGDDVTVKDSDGDKHKCDIDDLKKVEPEEEAQAIEVGDKVKWEDTDGDEKTGKVKKIDGDDVTVRDSDGEKHVVDIDDLTKVE